MMPELGRNRLKLRLESLSYKIEYDNRKEMNVIQMVTIVDSMVVNLFILCSSYIKCRLHEHKESLFKHSLA